MLSSIKSPASPFYSPRGALSSLNRANSIAGALSNIPILVTAFLAILATGGPTYSFGVYAGTLKHSLGLTQSQLETLGAASFGAGFISWIPGLAVDIWGSRTALILGGLLQSVGLATYWLVARFDLLPSYMILPTLSCLSVLIFTSNNLVIGGVFKSIVVSCGLGTKGKAVGAAKAYLGMGAGVFSSLFRALPTQSDLDFLAMSSLTAIGAIALPAALALPTNAQMAKKGTKDESTPQHYHLVYAGLFAVALVVMGTSALDLLPATTTTISLDSGLFQWFRALFIVAVWIGPILGLFLLPTQSKAQKEKLNRQQSVLRRKVRQAMEREPNEKMRLLPPKVVSIAANSKDQPTAAAISLPQQPEASSRSVTSFASAVEEDGTMNLPAEDLAPQETPQAIQDLTLVEMLQTLRAWLFLGASTILVGAGTMLTINMGQLVQAQRFPPATAAAALSMFSVAQALARVTSGAVSEAALQWETKQFGIRRGVPRPAFLVLSCALAVAGHAMMACYSSNLLLFVLGIVLTGFSFGALWPLMVLIVGDLFGTVNHGANYMFMDGFTCAVGTLSVAKFLTQFVYEQHLPSGTIPQGAEEDGFNPNACYGDDCFRLTHMIISALCLVSLFACTALLYMTRSSYGALL